MRRLFRGLSWLMAAVLLTGALAGCGSGAAGMPKHDLSMASMADMAMEVQNAPEATRESYQFAFANKAVLEQIPCYCGCKDIEHKNNYDCYVDGQTADGKLTYDPHALNCQVCVDITQDAMRMTREGKSPSAIKTYVDRNYSRFGPSNMN